MKREEEIKEAAKEYDLWSIGQQLFIVGAQWADEHPRKGLWDKEKVIGWLKENVQNYTYSDGWGDAYIDEEWLVDDLTKAMEK